ncbi:MAG: DUF1156 domain-containing protein [Fimbriimonadales bacterium]
MPEPDHPRLIEAALPPTRASLDSVHEKNVRHGHTSTLPIWPARRPLAACRAALIATLLPDPDSFFPRVSPPPGAAFVVPGIRWDAARTPTPLAI